MEVDSDESAASPRGGDQGPAQEQEQDQDQNRAPAAPRYAMRASTLKQRPVDAAAAAAATSEGNGAGQTQSLARAPGRR